MQASIQTALDAVAPQDVAPFIRIEGVTKRFGTFTAVSSVTLDIKKGEIFALLGGSGCGKTTLLRMLAGFETPTEGRIFIDGQDMTGVPAYERPVHMMFQSYALFPHMTVEKNVAYGLKHERMTDAERKARVREMLELVQLTQFSHRKPHQISGGQRQRVALARALARQPKLLLLDEPLAALDKKLREHTQFELMDIQDKTGTTFMVVTHDQEEAMILSNRIAVMDKGEVKQVGTPTEIYEYPDSRFVAGFIGSITFFDGKVASVTGDTAMIEVPDFGGQVSARAIPGISAGQDITLALRPEKIAIGRTKPEGPNAIEGTVDDLGYFGKDSLYKVKLGSGKVLSVLSVNGRRVGEGERVADWEDRVWLSFDPGAAILLTQ
ncbi:ABC transporter ATP-binding protein [Defluviimonas sp. WL0002]|uniref:Spermidine/putrescine import ATP-binding protein PotA n=1 Tax=Albidovulum marisflavi TaxID=2984159 RepID=A0ABT2Z9A3_9RHOB|nr:ABC transporter ATP-binding protein [Defluviimonas sp. WL0002]MCV2867725.1 ABC transporter ATP-binding protein [Defluviimonas sp. WL0002]